MAQKKYKRADLSKMKMTELYEIAKHYKLKNIKKIKKFDLIQQLTGELVIGQEEPKKKVSKPKASKPKASKPKASKPKATKPVEKKDESGLVKFHRGLPKRSSMTWR